MKCPSCEGKGGRYLYGRRVSKWVSCPVCKGTKEITIQAVEAEGAHVCERCKTPGQKVLVLGLCPGCAGAELEALRKGNG